MIRGFLVASVLLLGTGLAVRGEDVADQDISKQDTILKRLEIKEAQLAALLSEVEHLRRLAGHAAQMSVKVHVVEIDLTRLREEAIELGMRSSDPQRAATLSAIAARLQERDDVGERDGSAFCRALPAEHPFFDFLDHLEAKEMATSIVDANLGCEPGRATWHLSGGAFPCVLGPAAGDVASDDVRMQFYGTKIDLTARPLVKDRVRLNVRIAVSEIDLSIALRKGEHVVPGLKSQEFAIERDAEFGKTLICTSTAERRTYHPSYDERDLIAGVDTYLHRRLRFVFDPAQDEDDANAPTHVYRKLIMVTPQACDLEAVEPQPAVFVD
ncbi:MAG TPA: hypothetical protein VGN12_18730 [Pirellulales bacterium]